MSAFQEALARHVLPHFPIPEEAARLRMERHYDLLMRWNQRINLTAIREVEESVLRHFGESVALAHALPAGALRIADAGSGAGFPGIPLAILRPECAVTLVELDIRKSVFLREATIDLPNCRVFQGRLTDHRGEYDWLVSRALHWSELERWTGWRNVALLVSSAQRETVAQEWRAVHWSGYRELPWPGQGGILMGELASQLS